MNRNFIRENIKRALRGAMAMALVCVASTAAKASIITFSGGTGSNPYYEGGYEVQLLSGPLSINPGAVYLPGGFTHVPGVGNFGGETTGELEVQVAGGGAFTFNGFSMSTSPLDVVNFTFIGKLNGSIVASGNGSDGYSYPNPYTAFQSGTSAQMDSLFISLDQNAYDPGSAAYLTAINVSSTVPDQASTIGLLSLALVPLFAVGIRQRRVTA